MDLPHYPILYIAFGSIEIVTAISLTNNLLFLSKRDKISSDADLEAFYRLASIQMYVVLLIIPGSIVFGWLLVDAVFAGGSATAMGIALIGLYGLSLYLHNVFDKKVKALPVDPGYEEPYEDIVFMWKKKMFPISRRKLGSFQKAIPKV